jgi:hypothetical protein
VSASGEPADSRQEPDFTPDIGTTALIWALKTNDFSRAF